MVLRVERDEGNNDIDPSSPRDASPHCVGRKHALLPLAAHRAQGGGGDWVEAAALVHLTWQVR